MVENGGPDELRIPEELEFEPVKRQPPRNNLKSAIFLTLVMLGGAGGAGWYFLGDQIGKWFPEKSASGIPLIRADKSPVKVRPENPGGMEVPNRDKLIYGRMRDSEDRPQVERLMGPPESPLPVPKAESGPETAPEPETAPPFESLTAGESQAPQPSPGAGSSSPSPTVTKPEPDLDMTKSLEAAVSSLDVKQPTVPPKAEVLSAVPPASAPPPPELKVKDDPEKAAAGKSRDYRVQLAAVRSPSGAKNEWKRLKRKYPDLLDGLSLFITKVDLGLEKGIFYRLRAGPVADEAAARRLCEKLTKRKVGCLIVRPQK